MDFACAIGISSLHRRVAWALLVCFGFLGAFALSWAEIKVVLCGTSLACMLLQMSEHTPGRLRPCRRRGELHCVQRHREQCGRQKNRCYQTGDLKSCFNFNVFFIAGLLALAHLKSCVGLLVLGAGVFSALLWVSLLAAKSICFVLTSYWRSVFMIALPMTLIYHETMTLISCLREMPKHSGDSDKSATRTRVATRRRRCWASSRKHRRYARSLSRRRSNGLVSPNQERQRSGPGKRQRTTRSAKKTQQESRAGDRSSVYGAPKRAAASSPGRAAKKANTEGGSCHSGKDEWSCPLCSCTIEQPHYSGCNCGGQRPNTERRVVPSAMLEAYNALLQNVMNDDLWDTLAVNSVDLDTCHCGLRARPLRWVHDVQARPAFTAETKICKHCFEYDKKRFGVADALPRYYSLIKEKYTQRQEQEHTPPCILCRDFPSARAALDKPPPTGESYPASRSAGGGGDHRKAGLFFAAAYDFPESRWDELKGKSLCHAHYQHFSKQIPKCAEEARSQFSLNTGGGVWIGQEHRECICCGSTGQKLARDDVKSWTLTGLLECGPTVSWRDRLDEICEEKGWVSSNSGCRDSGSIYSGCEWICGGCAHRVTAIPEDSASMLEAHEAPHGDAPGDELGCCGTEHQGFGIDGPDGSDGLDTSSPTSNPPRVSSTTPSTVAYSTDNRPASLHRLLEETQEAASQLKAENIPLHHLADLSQVVQVLKRISMGYAAPHESSNQGGASSVRGPGINRNALQRIAGLNLRDLGDDADIEAIEAFSIQHTLQWAASEILDYGILMVPSAVVRFKEMMYMLCAEHGATPSIPSSSKVFKRHLSESLCSQGNAQECKGQVLKHDLSIVRTNQCVALVDLERFSHDDGSRLAQREKEHSDYMDSNMISFKRFRQLMLEQELRFPKLDTRAGKQSSRESPEEECDEYDDTIPGSVGDDEGDGVTGATNTGNDETPTAQNPASGSPPGLVNNNNDEDTADGGAADSSADATSGYLFSQMFAGHLQDDLDSSTLQRVQQTEMSVAEKRNPPIHRIMDPKLVAVFEKLLATRGKKSPHYRRAKGWKICNLICQFCAAHDPRKPFLQVLNGYSAFAGSMKVHAWQHLVRAGACAGYSTVNAIKCAVSGRWNPSKNLDPRAFVVASFDNLNFLFQYAFKANCGGGQTKRALAVLTSQFCQRILPENFQPLCGKIFGFSDADDGSNDPTIHMFRQQVATGNDPLTPFHDGAQDSAYTSYADALHDVLVGTVSSGSDSVEGRRLLDEVKQKLPHKAPPSGHRVTLCHIAEASSATEADVGDYLLALKKQLKVGKQGGPRRLLVTGDQQTYVLMRNLKKQAPQEYRWLIPYPGDWHLAFNCAQALADHVWHGGLQKVAIECGLPNISASGKWRDLHMVLLTLWHALHRALLEKYIELHAGTPIPDNNGPDTSNDGPSVSPPSRQEMQRWMDELRAGKSSANETIQFWARWLQALDAYVALVIAIRNGDWHLRCAAIRGLAPIFFVMNKPKYQVLIREAIEDFKLLPKAVIDDFVEHGSFTVSLKGNPGCNQALDEVHESYANLLLKRYVGRASVHRLQEMAGFMTEIVGSLEALEQWWSYHKGNAAPPSKKHQEKQRAAAVVTKYLRPLMMEWDNNEFGLRRHFLDNSNGLDRAAVNDLLQFYDIGMERLRSVVKQCSFLPPLERRRGSGSNATFSKMRTFAPQTTRPRPERRVTSALMDVIDTLSKKLRNFTSYCPTTKWPLALATINGLLRTTDDTDVEQRKSSKSKMVEVLEKLVGYESLRCLECPWMTRLYDRDFLSTVHAVLFDGLKIIHEGPKTGQDSYKKWFGSISSSILNRFHRGAKTVYWIVDKPEHAQYMRGILHNIRNAARGGYNECSSFDEDSTPLRDQEFQKQLANPAWKSALISHLSDYLKKAVGSQLHHDQSLIIDVPGAPSPLRIEKKDGEIIVSSLDALSHNLGEADYAIWFHARNCKEKNIIIAAGDTDIFMYGLALTSVDALGPDEKTIMVERKRDSDYLNLNTTWAALQKHEKLSQVHQPAVLLLFVYLFGGSDYLSAFYNIGHKMWVERLCESANFILDPARDPRLTRGGAEEPLVSYSSDDRLSGNGCVKMNIDAALRLISVPYFRRGKQHIVSHIGAPHVTDLNNIQHLLWKQSALPHRERLPEFQEHLTKVVLRGSSSMDNILLDPLPDGNSAENRSRAMGNYLEIIRRAVFLSCKKSEAMLLPSKRALELHLARTQYIMSLVMLSVSGNHPSRETCFDYGWQGTSEADIKITWDDNVASEEIPAPTSSNIAEGCGSRCNKAGETCKACKCVKNKRSCSDACHCLGKPGCQNPHGCHKGHSAAPEQIPGSSNPEEGNHGAIDFSKDAAFAEDEQGEDSTETREDIRSYVLALDPEFANSPEMIESVSTEEELVSDPEDKAEHVSDVLGMNQDACDLLVGL